MNRMGVGDIGVLQNLDPEFKLIGDGDIAEIVHDLHPLYSAIHKREVLAYTVKVPGSPSPMGSYELGWAIQKHQIRPITNPDAKQTAHEQRENKQPA